MTDGAQAIEPAPLCFLSFEDPILNRYGYFGKDLPPVSFKRISVCKYDLVPD